MKILIVRVGAMGDVLHALSAVTALRHARPDWQIDWIVDERWHPLLQTLMYRPVVDLAFPLPIRAWKRFPRSPELLRSVKQLHGLRRRRYDLAIDMQGTLRSALIGRLAGGAPLAGYADPRETPARLLYTRRLPREGEHVVEQGAALLGQACGVDLLPGVTELPPELPVDEAAELWASTLLSGLGHPERLAVLAPSAGWAAKQWPAEHFAALARALSAEGWTVLVNNPGGSDRVALQVLAGAQGAARGIACSVAEFASLLRRSALLVGGDSGPLHLAAALGTPLVALFGPTDPARNGPWGPGPHRVLRHPDSATSYSHVAEADPGLAQISVEDVLAAVQAL